MSNKTLILTVGAVCLLIGVTAFFILNPKKSSSPILNQPEAKKEVVPSKTFIEYNDPSGFSFSYPDNISLSNKAADEEDSAQDAYADLQLFSADKSGSINLRIVDTKFKSIEDYKKQNQIPEGTPVTSKKLGDLEAFEIKTPDRLMLASIDQGILFEIDMPLVEENFWNEIYQKVLTSFSFGAQAPVAQNGNSASAPAGDEIIFEGEEVIE